MLQLTSICHSKMFYNQSPDVQTFFSSNLLYFFGIFFSFSTSLDTKRFFPHILPVYFKLNKIISILVCYTSIEIVLCTKRGPAWDTKSASLNCIIGLLNFHTKDLLFLLNILAFWLLPILNLQWSCAWNTLAVHFPHLYVYIEISICCGGIFFCLLLRQLSFSRLLRQIYLAPIRLSLELLAVRADLEVLIEVGDNRALIVCDLLWIIDLQNRPHQSIYLIFLY